MRSEPAILKVMSNVTINSGGNNVNTFGAGSRGRPQGKRKCLTDMGSSIAGPSSSPNMTEVFVPVLLAAMSLLRVERANGPFHECGNDGVPDCWPVVKSQIDHVFGLKRKSAQRTACERRFASQVWEMSYAFMFGAGRPASFLVEKNPVDIVPDDAIRAFTPYLYRTQDEEEKQGDKDGASYRDFEAGSSATAEPDRDEAEELSSSASRDIGRPLSDLRGGNAADESVDDADDCPDDDDNDSGAG